ncbi:hypothetical protein R1T16_05680 [Flavobacterium sp. DG1-102-2]|uniref:hypothetical protein n=1 Tax=Flavobacterium sp. DG1-102-2 TaxID=3081663 RepID=UPI002949D395|nr:hypothetical protein [Flavobacterium sp. DG1-102-2]MDV6167906.1 hypothetical protein [Flavobacterium sp. DG1-102-2]
MYFNCPEQLAGFARLDFYLISETSNWPFVVNDANAGTILITPQVTIDVDGSIEPETIKITDDIKPDGSGDTDRQHNYSEKLQFSIQKSSAIDNIGFVSVTPSHPDIEILNVAVNGNNVTIGYVLNNGFTTNNLRLQYRMAGSTTWYAIGDILSNGSVTITRTAGTYSARIVDYNNLANVSAIVTFTI